MMNYETEKEDEEAKKKPKEKNTLHYGWWKFKPRFLQCLNNLGFYMTLAVTLHLIFGFVSGWVGAALQQIEKQFGLSSSVSATLATASDLGMSISVAFVGYIGTKFNKAKGMACGLFLFGLGLSLNALPHYLLKPYKPPELIHNSSSPVEVICPLNSSINANSTSDNDGGNHMAYFSLLLVGQVFAGIGSTPVSTLGISYIDDNAAVANAAILIGVVSTVTTVGGALSALVGGPIIEYLYVDFDRVDVSSLPFGSGDPQWVGAWWLGFIISGLVCIIISIPISGFPKMLPSSPLLKEKPKQKKELPINVFLFLKNTVVDFFQALFKLIFDLEFIFINIASSIEGVAVAGMSMFVFKFVNHEYDMPYDIAGYVIGSKAIVGSFGFILAGYLIKWFKLDLLGMEKVSLLFNVISVILGLSMFLGCPNTDMPGVERPYADQSSISGLISKCQGQCICEGEGFRPVCGSDGLVYFSPCHAGCLDTYMDGGDKIFGSCSCIAESMNVSRSDIMATATSGKCDVECWQMYFVMTCIFLVYILIVSCMTFSSLIVLRCVDQELKPFALAIKMVFIRVLGTIPAPLVIGWIVDSACSVWSGSGSGDTGGGGQFCEMYDKQKLTTGIAFMWLASGAISCFFMFLTVVANVRKSRRNDKKKNKEDMNEVEKPVIKTEEKI